MMWLCFGVVLAALTVFIHSVDACSWWWQECR
jgi:hypothetical protein